MKQTKRWLSLLLSVLLLFGTAPSLALAEADTIQVYLTVSNQGVLASALDGSLMTNRPVTVTDVNLDGAFSYHEALTAAHKTYHREDGYSSAACGMDGNRLWGVDTENTLYYVNDIGLSLAPHKAVIEAGDRLVASVNSDNSGLYSDWYTFFNATSKEVETDEVFTLNLKGFLGMAYLPEDLTPAPLNGIFVGLWENGTVTPIPEKTTDTNGNVSLSFTEAGTYYVTASGTVRASVTDWSVYPPATVETDCPIIPPFCTVTVTEGDGAQEPEESLMGDEAAAKLLYDEFSAADYANATQTPLVFPLTYRDEVYTNVETYLKAWALAETGREILVNYTPAAEQASYTHWENGVSTTVFYAGMDETTEIRQDYFPNNSPKTGDKLTNVSFTVGEVTSNIIPKLSVSEASKVRTPEEIVAYGATQFPLARILSTNVSAEKVKEPLGEKSGSTVALPNTMSLYGQTLATVSWSAEHISGRSDAFSIASSTRKTTILRPNVGEENAVFDVKATIASATDASIFETVTHRITIPAFEEILVPIEIPEGATLTLKDKYYNKNVAAEYIQKEESDTEGYDLYHCILHASATGEAQKFDYQVAKEGYITTTGTLQIADIPEKITIPLTASTEDDAKLKILSVDTAKTAHHDVAESFFFDKDTYEYNLKVSGVRYVVFSAETMAEGASVKITSYYKNQNDANAGKLTTGQKTISSLKCYLPDAADTVSTVTFTVTAPASSTQELKTRIYKINVEKVAPSGPLTALTLTAVSSTGGKKDSLAGDEGYAPAEGVLNPVFVSGTRILGTYTVNYWFDKIKVMPTTVSGCTILVGEQSVASGKQSSEISLAVGENQIPVLVTDEENEVCEYTLTVYRKSRLEILSAQVENGRMDNPFPTEGAALVNSGSFPFETETLRIKFGTNCDSDADIRVKLDKESYFGKAGDWFEIPVKGVDSIWFPVYLYRTVNGVAECQGYGITMNRLPATHPNEVSSYLPAPGQFVNQPAYAEAEGTLTGEKLITLGSFGGNVVYHYTTPIENDPKNPYGIDFIVKGNAFASSDGTVSLSAAEPAAVMVSKDGVTWYELAGSEYYDANTYRNVTVTYQNPDTNFRGAADVPWTDDTGESGSILKNGRHTQSYYPNPAIYGSYQEGIGQNETYTETKVSFTGTKIADTARPSFGYADVHPSGEDANSSFANPKGNRAANPYTANHNSVYNGDGFDLSWAVDSQGNSVELDSISYLKIYNPILSSNGSLGEKSPEILQVLRAESAEKEVGVTDGLTSLSVNGEKISLKENQYVYEVEGKGAESLVITPVHENPDVNIYISNQRVESGESTSALAAVSQLRILVQEDEKEPAIYLLQFTNVKNRESNAGLTSLTLTPGDDTGVPHEDGKLAFEVSNVVSSVRLTPAFHYYRATALLSGQGMEDVPLTHKSAGKAVSLQVGENSFTLTVTSADGTEQQTYSLIITRAEASGGGSSLPDENEIRVKFSLTGDTLHYDHASGKNTASHSNPTWIRAEYVDIPKGSTVKYLTELMLHNKGIDYVSDGTYLASVNGIGEFDNGPNAGWLYRINGTISEEGYDYKELKNGDIVKWFYSDDYTKERGYEGGWNSGSSSSKPAGQELVVIVPTEKTYPDIQGHWSEEAVLFVSARKIFQGTEIGFEPDSHMSRAMVATTLFRMENGKREGENPFADVPEDAWYSDGVIWAHNNGIAKGTGDAFDPHGNVTREQLCTMLYRYVAFLGKEVSVTSGENTFADSALVSPWATEAMNWAIQTGLLKGKPDNLLDPAGNATRGEVAAIYQRFITLFLE